MTAPRHQGGSFQIHIFRIFSQRIRHVLTKLDRLSKYTPDILVNRLFVGWQAWPRRGAFYSPLCLLSASAADMPHQLAHIQRAAHQGIVDIPRLTMFP
jgi:hypothetical protein